MISWHASCTSACANLLCKANFCSGWEWGYWIGDVMTARAAWATPPLGLAMEGPLLRNGAVGSHGERARASARSPKGRRRHSCCPCSLVTALFSVTLRCSCPHLLLSGSNSTLSKALRPIAAVFDAAAGGDGCRDGCSAGGVGARVTEALIDVVMEQRQLLIHGGAVGGSTVMQANGPSLRVGFCIRLVVI